MLVGEVPAGEIPAGDKADALGGEDDSTPSSDSLPLSRLKWNLLPILGNNFACSFALLDASSLAALAAALAPSGPVKLLGLELSCEARAGLVPAKAGATSDSSIVVIDGRRSADINGEPTDD